MTTNLGRPYPDGLAWDEALRQRRRAEQAEAENQQLRAFLEALSERSDEHTEIEQWLSPEAYDELMRDRQETLHELAKRDAEIERLQDSHLHNENLMLIREQTRLLSEIERLRALLSEARDALRYETEANYPDRNQLPSDMHGYEMDMDIVHRIEAALAAKENKP